MAMKDKLQITIITKSVCQLQRIVLPVAVVGPYNQRWCPTKKAPGVNHTQTPHGAVRPVIRTPRLGQDHDPIGMSNATASGSNDVEMTSCSTDSNAKRLTILRKNESIKKEMALKFVFQFILNEENTQKYIIAGDTIEAARERTERINTIEINKIMIKRYDDLKQIALQNQIITGIDGSRGDDGEYVDALDAARNRSLALEDSDEEKSIFTSQEITIVNYFLRVGIQVTLDLVTSTRQIRFGPETPFQQSVLESFHKCLYHYCANMQHRGSSLEETHHQMQQRCLEEYQWETRGLSVELQTALNNIMYQKTNEFCMKTREWIEETERRKKKEREENYLKIKFDNVLYTAANDVYLSHFPRDVTVSCDEAGKQMYLHKHEAACRDARLFYKNVPCDPAYEYIKREIGAELDGLLNKHLESFMKNHMEFVQRNKKYENEFWRQLLQRLEMSLQNRQGTRAGCNCGVFFVVNEKNEYLSYHRQLQELQQQSFTVVNGDQRTPEVAAVLQPGRAAQTTTRGADLMGRAAQTTTRGTDLMGRAVQTTTRGADLFAAVGETQPQDLTVNRATSCSFYSKPKEHREATWVGVYFFPHSSSIRPLSESPSVNYNGRTDVAYCTPYYRCVQHDKPELINLEPRNNNRNFFGHGFVPESDSSDYGMQDDDSEMSDGDDFF